MTNHVAAALLEFDSVVADMVGLTAPACIFLACHGAGEFAEWLLDQALQRRARLVVADRAPTEKLRWLAQNVTEGRLELAECSGVQRLERGGTFDVAILADEPNRYSVERELKLLDEGCSSSAYRLPVVLVHGTGWPFANRDFYRDPDAIPVEQRHRYSRTSGPVLTRSDLRPWGFGIGEFAIDATEGPTRGVVPAVLEFLKGHTDYASHDVDAFFGLSILARRSLWSSSPGRDIAERTSSKLFSRLERERLALLLQTLRDDYMQRHPGELRAL